LCKLAERRSLDVHPAFHAFTLEEGLGVFALEASYRHGCR
jgi:hypothetical protein